MANILPLEKQTMVIHALAEGNSIRSIERMTGVNRNTIMSLGLRVGKACEKLMDEKMRDLDCKNVQVDEIWGFVGKKQKQVRRQDSRDLGDVWTFVGIDSETKVVPSYIGGKRDAYHTRLFIDDLASRLSNRIQLSSDSMKSYQDAVAMAFGNDVDYGQIVKTYALADLSGKYSPGEVVSMTKTCLVGAPRASQISTSHVERQNLTIRMHNRRMTRLTNAFSKKRESFKAAMALHFAYYNFVKIHSTIRMTPAMAANVTDHLWEVSDLVKLA
jgi:IS1 family transposase